MEPVESVTLKLPSKSHVYDVRHHEYLGQREEIALKLQPRRAEVFALMPYAATLSHY